MTWKTIFNPFLKFDEKTLFITGILSITIVFIISYFLGFQSDSLFHFRYINPADSLFQIILSTLIVYAVSIIILFVYGKIINKRTRLIDIITPVFIAQFPVILMILLMKIPFISKAENEVLASVEKNTTEINPVSIIIISIYSFISLAIAAYGIAILYNGFKTATNMKKWQHIVIFAVILLTMMVTMQFL
jgi:hypothetical protein